MKRQNNALKIPKQNKKEGIVRIKKILIIKPSSMGDIIHSLPVLHAIHQAFPEDEIHWLVARGFEGLLQGHPLIKKLIVINKDEWKKIGLLHKTFGELRGLSNTLKDERYDIAIDLQGLLRSALLVAMTKAPVKIGFSDAREGSPFFYNQKIEGGRDIHAVHRYLKVAKAIIGQDIQDIQFPLPPIIPSDKVKRIIDKTDVFNIVIPGARWQSKKWQPERFAEIVSLLDGQSIIIGTKADTKTAQIIQQFSPHKVIDMTARTDLKDMIYLIDKSHLVVTNDTGPMHIASALDKPLVAIFGPTNPVRTGPFGNKHQVVIADIDCSPCYKKTCSKMTCMQMITVEQVMEAINLVKKAC